MPSQIYYKEVYSQFFLKVEGYDIFDKNISDEYREVLLCSWLRSSIGKPYVNRLFSTVTLSDPYQDEDPETGEIIDMDGIIEYELVNKIDEDFGDKQFITEVLAYGMALCWLEPKVYSLTNIAQFFGTSDEKLRDNNLTARCIWKHCSVFLRICWNTLRALMLKQKDEICLNGIV